MKDVLIWVLRLAVLLIALLSLAGFAGDWGSYFDLACHFRLQYLMASLVLLLGFLGLKKNRMALVAAFCLLLNLLPIAAYYFPQPSRESSLPKSQAASFTLLHLNVLTTNSEKNKVAELIEAKKPDIISLLEVDQVWVDSLAPVLANYPYQLTYPQSDNFGIALYSKIPLKNMSVKYFGEDFHHRYFPSIYAESDYGENKENEGDSFSILTTHPLPPISGFNIRNTQLQDIAEARGEWNKKLIVVGDLNITPWSVFFQRFLNDTELRDSSLGFGVQPSWPSSIPLASIPIDHVLVSPKIQVVNRETGSNVGSDHLPVFVELRF